MTTYRTQNPSTGKVVRSWDSLDPREVGTAIDTAEEAFTSWRRTSVE